MVDPGADLFYGGIFARPTATKVLGLYKMLITDEHLEESLATVIVEDLANLLGN